MRRHDEARLQAFSLYNDLMSFLSRTELVLTNEGYDQLITFIDEGIRSLDPAEDQVEIQFLGAAQNFVKKMGLDNV